MEENLREDSEPPQRFRCTKRQWNDWNWQVRNRIRTVEKLQEIFPEIDISQLQIAEVIKKYPFAITPYYASLIKKLDYTDPVFQLSIPNYYEMEDPLYLSSDPLHENDEMPVPGLVHKYKDRALFMATTTCGVFCRFCSRKRIVGVKEVSCTSDERLEGARKYLTDHPEIIDVIVSGGDPLTLPDKVIEKILKMLRSVKSIQIIRIGTRTPVVMPQRITNRLVNMLKKYNPIWINTHFNHFSEITPESSEACHRIVDAGIPLNNQSVLLRGVNDDPDIMVELCRGLLKNRCRPYYIFMADKVKGTYHFHTKIEKGIEIIKYMRGRVSGLGIPTLVADLPDGGGKIPLLPNYIEKYEDGKIIFNNLFGGKVEYPDQIMV